MLAATDITPRQSQPVQEHTGVIESNPIQPATTQTRRSPVRPHTSSTLPRPQTSSTISKFEDDPLPLPELHRDRGAHPLPPLPQARLAGGEGRLPMLRPVDSHLSGGPRSGIDWIVPVDHDKVVRLSFASTSNLNDAKMLSIASTSHSWRAPSAYA